MKLFNKMDLALLNAKTRLQNAMENEDGDTNFISILVILGIALALAAVFIGFKDRIMNFVNSSMGDFFTKTGV